MECTSGTIDDVYRMGKRVAGNEDDNGVQDTRRIMIELKSKKAKYEVLRNVKLLKNWTTDKDPTLGNKSIFINQDESPLARKENYRLRTERNRLRNLEENKAKKIIIYT